MTTSPNPVYQDPGSAPEVDRLRPLDYRRRARLLLCALQARMDLSHVTRGVARAFATVATDRFDQGTTRLFEEIEDRRVVLSDSDEVVVIDLTAHVPGIRFETTVGEWGSGAAVDPPRGRLLFALVRELRPTRCLELGTNMGISSAYVAAALGLNDDGRMISVDMVEQASQRASQHHSQLGLDRAEFRTGLFQDLLAPSLGELGGCDFAFIDGDHREESTIKYFEHIAAAMASDAVMVFDNVAGTDEMERAWARIRADSRVRFAVAFEALGVAVLR